MKSSGSLEPPQLLEGGGEGALGLKSCSYLPSGSRPKEAVHPPSLLLLLRVRALWDHTWSRGDPGFTSRIYRAANREGYSQFLGKV